MKALLHFVPRAGASVFMDRLRTTAQELAERGAAAGIEVGTLEALDDDPLGRDTPYRFTLELRGGDAPAHRRLIGGLGARLDDVVHADLSTCLVGKDVVFVEGKGPVRYQYLMRRRAEFDPARYLERYETVHSAFGLKTPGIVGYVQFHVDAEASRHVAAAAGLGTWGVDSVSELHLESVESFLAAIAKSDIGAQAIADEEHFVDRARSLAFCSRVSS